MADLIDRDALIAEYDRVHIGAPGGARKLMVDAPAVNRWIPCSERLPSEFNYVLCSGRDGIGVRRYIGSKWLDENAIAYSTNEITHWMPLPEPPEKE